MHVRMGDMFWKVYWNRLDDKGYIYHSKPIIVSVKPLGVP